MTEEFDVVQKAKQYNVHPSGVECIEICGFLPFTLGNAFKYIWRYEHKENPIQGLQKALWYVNTSIDINAIFFAASLRVSKQMFDQSEELKRKFDLVLETEDNIDRKKFLNIIYLLVDIKITEDKTGDLLNTLKMQLQLIEMNYIHNSEQG